jgi:thioester reductase-like protein
MKDTILLTGATGTVGRSLLPILADRGDVEKVYLLLRKPAESPDFDRPGFDRMMAVSGDVTAGDQLGLDAPPSGEIAKNVTVIIHGAAETGFSAPLAELRAVNVEGTKNILNFAAHCPRLRAIACLSTVHVAGKRTGVIEEEFVEHSAGFVNGYEQSKYEAELLLCEKMKDLPISVVRLSTVLGDSGTGEVAKLAAIHQGLRLYYHSLAPMIPGIPSSPVDLIASDYAAAAIAHLAIAQFSAGQVFHLCGGRHLLSLDELLKLTHEAFTRYRPSWRKRSIAMPAIVDLPTFELFARSVQEVGDNLLRHSVDVIACFAPQLAYPKSFEDGACMRALANLEREKPRILDFYPKVVRWLVESGWADRNVATTVEAVAS